MKLYFVNWTDGAQQSLNTYDEAVQAVNKRLDGCKLGEPSILNKQKIIVPVFNGNKLLAMISIEEHTDSQTKNLPLFPH